jgi:hypothetical protein
MPRDLHLALSAPRVCVCPAQFCDRGCLRDALDAGALLTPEGQAPGTKSTGLHRQHCIRVCVCGTRHACACVTRHACACVPRHVALWPPGVSYGAVLETAADVARAMLHLHLNNVIHGDLKVCLGFDTDHVLLCWCDGSCPAARRRALLPDKSAAADTRLETRSGAHQDAF